MKGTIFLCSFQIHLKGVVPMRLHLHRAFGDGYIRSVIRFRYDHHFSCNAVRQHLQEIKRKRNNRLLSKEAVIS
nr:MAG TPA: hypothetical protein [Caudoviricetes sp.]